uniref:Tospovirus resistance protein C n=1 Tax=Solanum tuberosum TaxID=4113 RepID=M1D2Z2_SOLTU
MAQNEIEEMLDHLRRIKSGGNLDSAKIDQIKELEMVLRILRTFIIYHRVHFRDSLVKHTNNAKLTMAMLPDQCKTNLNLERLESHLLEFLERNTILSDNYELNSFDLSDYMNWLEKNLNDVLMILSEGDRSDPPEENLEIHKFIKEVKIIQKKLRFLTYLYATEINGYVNHKKLECLETRIQFMANNVGQLCLAILGYVVSDEVDTYEYYDILYKSPYLLFLIVLVELEMKKIFLSELKASKFTYSRTFKDKKLPKGFSHHLHSNLEKELSTLISILEKELSSLSSIFRDVAKVHHEHKIPKDLQRRTINLAYDVEVAIDSILVQYNVLLHIFCSLPTILEEIKQINAQVTEMWSADVALKPCYVVAPFKYLPTRHSNLVTYEEIVGFRNDIEKIIQYLIKGTNELDVIPIVGMGGQGKTTIARKVYNSDNVVSHFDVRAWCIVSQTYNRRTLLQEIFSQVIGSKDKGDKDDIFPDMLRKSLMGKRYLIVLDDMWDCMEWDDLRLCFPNLGNRSRIVVTTRLEKVGLSSLEYLQLWKSDYFESEEWCLGDITFHKLMFLNLTHLRISRWVASEESFPLLERFVIKECYNLEEIPLSFAYIPTLKHIKLIRCKNKPLEASALRIKDDVEENEGNDRIDLIIKQQKYRQSGWNSFLANCCSHAHTPKCPSFFCMFQVIGDQHISDDLSL